MKHLVTYSHSSSIFCYHHFIGGAFEGDMAFPYGFDPSKNSAAKGVALFGAHRWPNNVIPYDISAISCKFFPYKLSQT
jgi:hypothetical protein